MDSDEGVLIFATDREGGTAITTNTDLLPSASASFLLTRNDVTVGATSHACVQDDIQIPEMKNKDQPHVKATTLPQLNCNPILFLILFATNVKH